MNRLLRWIFFIPLALLLYALLLLLGSISLAWNLVAMLLYPVLPARVGRSLGRRVIAFAYRSFWATASAIGMMRIDANCLDALRDERGVIFVANHPTMLDALLLVARLPRSACIMKADLMRNIFLGAGARLARYIRNDSARTMVRLAVDDLKDGGQLVIFPEGTRTVPGRALQMQRAAANIALRGARVLTPVFIECEPPTLSKHEPWYRIPARRAHFTLRVGAELDLDAYRREPLPIASRRLNSDLVTLFAADGERR
jgi:1-acyl-sn-glycerol-3-phosphate acyltransferase